MHCIGKATIGALVLLQVSEKAYRTILFKI
jgi:hypothetical protein